MLHVYNLIVALAMLLAGLTPADYAKWDALTGDNLPDTQLTIAQVEEMTAKEILAHYGQTGYFSDEMLEKLDTVAEEAAAAPADADVLPAATEAPIVAATEAAATEAPIVAIVETEAPADVNDETVSAAPAVWNGVDGSLEFVYPNVKNAVYDRTPLTAGDHGRICDISFAGAGYGGFERVTVIAPAGSTFWSLNVTNAETIACRGFLGTPQELTAWAITPTHLQGFMQPSRDTEGVGPSIDEIMVLSFTYEGGVVTVSKEAPEAETGDLAGWFVSHFDLSFNEGENHANVPFSVTR